MLTREILILTTYIYPPIPTRNFDWSATVDGYEPGCPIGYGATEADAVADLVESIEADELGRVQIIPKIVP